MTTRARTGHKRRNLRRLSVASLVILFTGYVTLNAAARLVLEHYLAAIFQCDVSVGAVQLSHSDVQVQDIVIRTAPLDDQPLVTIAKVNAGLTIPDGFKHGIWADKVIVSDPRLYLTFSDAGELLTQFPSLPTGGGNGPIPLRVLKVAGGSISVTQIGKEAVLVDDARAVTVFGDKIQVAGVVPDLFGGIGKLHGALDSKSLAGDIQITAKQLSVSSADIASMPLGTVDLTSLEDCLATGSVVTSITIPANPRGLMDCPASVDCRLENLSIPGCGAHADGGRLIIKHESGKLSLVANANLMGGGLHVDSQLQVERARDGKIRANNGQLHWTIEGVPLQSIAQQLNLRGEMKGVLNASGVAKASLHQQRFQIKGTAETELSQIEVYGVRSEPLTLKASIDGDGKLMDGVPLPDHGHITLTAESAGVAVADVIARVQSRLKLMSTDGLQRIETAVHDVSLSKTGGRMSFSAGIEAPLAGIFDVRLVEAFGKLVGHRMAAGGYMVEDMVATCGVKNGTANLSLPEVRFVDILTGQPSTAAASCSIPFSPAGRAKVQLAMSNAPMSWATVLAGLHADSVRGAASMWLQAEAPIAECGDFAAWVGQGTVSSPLITVHGEPVADIQMNCSLLNKRIQVPQLSARWNNTSLTAHADAEVVHPFGFTGSVDVSDVDLAAVTRTAARLGSNRTQATGNLNLACRMIGDAASMNYRCDGEVQLENVNVDAYLIGNHQFVCSLTPTSVHIHEGDSQFFGGDVAVTATLRKSDFPISHISVGMRNVQAASLRDLFGLNASATGTFDGDAVSAEPMLPRLMHGQMNVQSRELHVAGVPIESFAAGIVAQSDLAVATVDVRAIGAECRSSIRASISDLMNFAPEEINDLARLPVFGQVTVKQVSVDRWRRTLNALPGRVRIPQELSGMLDAHLLRDPTSAATGTLLTGNTAIRNLSWNRVLLSRDLVAGLQVTPSAFEIKEIAGTFADGSVAGRGTIAYMGHTDGRFRLSVQRMNMSKLAATLGRQSSRISGAASLLVDGRLGSRQISGRAALSADRAIVQGVSLTHARLPLDWSVTPSTKEIHLSTNAASLSVGGGQVRGQGDARWNGRLDLNLTGSAQNVDTRKLMAGGAGMGGGMIDGSVHLRCRDANSINDLSGQFQGKLKDAQALKLPVLEQTSRFLGSLSRSTSFEDGMISGRLGNGVVTIEQLNLMASNVRMVINGTATLAGHLNLFVSAYTSETGPADRILDFANSPIMLAGPAPVVLVAKINDALKDRTIHINVGGTVGHPLVRLQPGRQLQQEALRFLVKSSLNYSPIRTVGATK